MAMSPGNQAITGGTVLRAPAIQSPNYAAGTSGWIIRQDGSAEFNNGIFRGSIEVGPNPGQHFVVNNTTTGDVVDVYNSSNQLVMSIDDNGNVTTFNPSTADSASLFSNGLHWTNTTRPPAGEPRIYGQGDSTNGNVITLATDEAVTGTGFAELQLFDTKANAGGPSSIMAFQRMTNTGTGGLLGTVVQTDGYGTGNYNFVHAGVYSGTVAGGDGHWIFNHGCSFQPVIGILTPWDATAADGIFQYMLWNGPFPNSTQCRVVTRTPSGGVPADGTLVGVHAAFFG
jgi:hypothetical protein